MDVPRTPPGPAFTGRYLVLCRETGATGMPKALRDKAGLTVASSSDFPRGAVDAAKLGGADGVYLETLGVVVTAAPPAQLGPMMNAPGAGGIIAVEPERYVYVFQIPRPSDYAPLMHPPAPPEFGARAYDAGALVCGLTAMAREPRVRETIDESAVTWGLTSTRVTSSSLTGRGVRVAVLDTGLALDHPDFAGRNVVSHSFIPGEPVQDGHSHGTHCAGTAVGCARPNPLPRYGIACDAELFVGKVLANSGQGVDGSVLAGIEWAIQNRCRIISMSLGWAVRPGDPFSQVHETVAQRALAANTLIIAAAGNESNRPEGVINPVGGPANCPSIMAVGAVDSEMKMGWFSTRGMDANGGAVDIVGPGLEIYSSIPLPERHGRKQGTSMACPHVAGIAALYAEANPSATAVDLWQLLTKNAKKLDLEVSDMGYGLVQAPA
jgi:subtilisin family serine protease